MIDESNSSENSAKKAREITNQVSQWWNHRDESPFSEDELTQLIQALSSPTAVWYHLPEDQPYNSLEAWCEAELGCEANFFLDEVEAVVGEEAIRSLRDRRLSAIFRPLS